MDLETKIYQKENNLHIWKLAKESISDIYSSRFLAKQLAIRDIKSQYRQSYFGLFWAVVTPIATALIWIFLNSSGTLRISDTGIPYPVYALSGTLLWSIITESINSPMSNTNSARSILSKINFPKEALITSGVYKLLFNSSIKIVLLIVFVFVFGIGFHWTLFLFPFIIIAAILFGTTIGLFLTPLGMLYTDVKRMIAFVLSFLMYATPVVYSIPKEGVIKILMDINPLTPIILTARDSIVGGDFAFLNYFLLIIGIFIPLFFVALLFYRISIPILVERMNA
ncbi:lipopolysaccharide transport system permease protein [Ulvibacter sp. MAR_2010_11]|uniref:ABC transporter permease n=1 Tax=Ulvibacter sp. MAR_2010_11 TaxID=1250229 RepID=UPI000C2C1C2D|nr:ABC transporter permease [Ulvibacter sp. MAR_2010_11]PKA82142.1 lipopolysaccharide transport system permease protein [Ulvibacter sp. MAR_2010_11]